jgi:Protein of unknown function (DUF732)
MRGIVTLVTGVGVGAIICAGPAHADDNQFLADLKSVDHPALSDADLLVDGHEACVEIGKEGLSPDAARSWVVNEVQWRGVPSTYAQAGTLVHFALKDLCPEIPNSTGI